MPEAIERAHRANIVFGACRSQVINERALWCRAPDHEGMILGEMWMREAARQMEERIRSTMAERGVTVPEGMVKLP